MVTVNCRYFLLCSNRGLGCGAGTTTFNFLSALNLGFFGAESQKTSVVGSLFASLNNAPLLQGNTMTFALQVKRTS